MKFETRWIIAITALCLVGFSMIATAPAGSSLFIPTHITPDRAVNTWLHSMYTGDREMYIDSISQGVEQDPRVVSYNFNLWKQLVRPAGTHTTGATVATKDGVNVEISPATGYKTNIMVVKEKGGWKVKE